MGVNYADITIFVILLLGALLGFRRGLIRSLLGLLGTLIALFLALKFHRPVALFAGEATGLLEKWTDFFTKHVPLPEAISALPVDSSGLQGLDAVIGRLFLPEFLKTQLWEWLELISRDATGISTIGELVGRGIALALLSALALFILWFIFENLISLGARFLTSLINKIKLLNGLNQLGGAFFGIAVNLLVLMVLFGTLSFLLDLGDIYKAEWANRIVTEMNSSIFIPFLRTGFEALLSNVIRLL